MVGPSNGSDGNYAWAEHSGWAKAAELHVDLDGVHTQSVYPSLADIEADQGPVPPVDCEWWIDGLGGGAHAVLAIDRSGSMSYLDEGGAQALDLAVDAALYFYNQTDNGDFVGVSYYSTAVDPAQSGGIDLEFAEKTGDIIWIDGGVNPGGDTDIAVALDAAFSDIVTTAGVPQSNRNIVLFSDGRHNGGGHSLGASAGAVSDGD